MKLTRRALSAGLLAPLGLAAAGPPQRPDTPARRRAAKLFKEIAASLYAWDLADEGCKGVLISSECGADGVGCQSSRQLRH